MLGTFLLDDPAGVPASTVAFIAEQLGLAPQVLTEYKGRPKAAYEGPGLCCRRHFSPLSSGTPDGIDTVRGS